jgi:Zn finger protein HypA/HybF involved in hydrogenase expression
VRQDAANALEKLGNNVKCNFCYSTIVVGENKQSVLIAQDYRETERAARRRGRKCPNCGKISCAICSHEAAVKLGKNYFICPGCGTDVRGNDL